MKRSYESNDNNDIHGLMGYLVPKKTKTCPTTTIPEFKFFLKLWDYEQLRFLYALRGLLNTGLIVNDVARCIIIEMLYLCTQIKTSCGHGVTLAHYRRVYRKKDNPLLYEAMVNQYERKQSLELDAARRRLLDVPVRYIHIMASNSPPDGYGEVYPYRPFKAWCHMKCLYIPFPITYQCVDIRDREMIRRHISHESISDTELQTLEDKATRVYSDCLSLSTRKLSLFGI